MKKLLAIFFLPVITLSIGTNSLAASRGDSSASTDQSRVVERQVEAVEVSVVNPDSMLPTPDNRVVNPDSMRPTPDVGVLNPDSMFPEPDSSNVERTGSADSNPTPHPKPLSLIHI